MPETDELVINTGPLLALIAGTGNLSILELLYKRVLVPLEVCREIEKGGESGFGLSEFKKSKFITKHTTLLKLTPFLKSSLDIGEASVIQLALDKNIHTVCIDESVGRRIARLNKLKLTGSIGILIRAKKAGCDFSMHDAIKQMQSKGIYLSQKVIDFAFKQII